MAHSRGIGFFWGRDARAETKREPALLERTPRRATFRRTVARKPHLFLAGSGSLAHVASDHGRDDLVRGRRARKPNPWVEPNDTTEEAQSRDQQWHRSNSPARTVPRCNASKAICLTRRSRTQATAQAPDQSRQKTPRATSCRRAQSGDHPRRSTRPACCRSCVRCAMRASGPASASSPCRPSEPQRSSPKTPGSRPASSPSSCTPSQSSARPYRARASRGAGPGANRA